MCLVAIAWKSHPNLPLALIANRDERHARATAAAGFDPAHPDVYGGRDLQAGGGWLMASRRGRLAAVTNVRAGLGIEEAPLSRGALVRDFVSGEVEAADFVEALAQDASRYGRFNLLLMDGEALWVASNHPVFSARSVAPGLHAMSNGAFDADWPKSTYATQVLGDWLSAREGEAMDAGHIGSGIIEPLFVALADTRRAPDEVLPDTGVGIELERRLSPAFILDPVYGTRCSSVVLADAAGGMLFAERRFDTNGGLEGESFEHL